MHCMHGSRTEICYRVGGGGVRSTFLNFFEFNKLEIEYCREGGRTPTPPLFRSAQALILCSRTFQSVLYLDHVVKYKMNFLMSLSHKCE